MAQAPAAQASAAATSSATAPADYRGQVIFGGLPVPGATVTATLGNTKLSTVTDAQGIYTFPALKDGVYAVEIDMLGFAPLKTEVVVPPKTAPGPTELKLLTLDQLRAAAKPLVGAAAAAPQVAAVTAAPTAAKKSDDKNAAAPKPEAPKIPEDSAAQGAADGMLVNGSVNNAASSQYALGAAFGNTRNNNRGLYNFGLALVLDNSALDARPYSLTGQETPKASYNRFTGVVTVGGPIKIPNLLRRGPTFAVQYGWTRNSTVTTTPGLVPTLAQRQGDFTGTTIYNPATGLPFTGNVPISPQAAALLALYPLPNVTSGSAYNYQIPEIDDTHQDNLQVRLDKSASRKDQLSGIFALESTRSSGNNLFNFNDTTDGLGLNTRVTWQHNVTQRLISKLVYNFSRQSTRVTPYWQNRANVSGAAGITGNDQSTMNWGPPTLSFNSISGLSDDISSFNRSRTDSISPSLAWYHGRHNVTVGMDFRRQDYNYLAQANPRGTFGFTGAATQQTVNGVVTGGSDFADFLLGVPDTSSIAYGNADKYLRQSVWDAYGNDDWRVSPQLTLSVGMRWEYGAPLTELHNRLVNLDVENDFAAVAPVLASDPRGSLTGMSYPTSLVNPTKSMFEPRFGMKWRPIAGSSIVVSAGYGIYADTSVYQSTTLQMAQQAPLSKSLSVQNSPTCQLSLANGFQNCGTSTATLFGIDPNFRVGYAQVWQGMFQRDLPGSLQMNITYLGIKGSHGMQESLPNTYPVGGTNPCPLCPLGFAYVTSNGTSHRESGSFQLRRRLHNGFTASALYTYSKALDDDSALGGQGASYTGSTAQGSAHIAQDWRNLDGERGLSNFDQRHVLAATVQYTSGMGRGGGTLMSGWRAPLLKEWTVLTTINAASGTPESPIYFAAVPNTSYYTVRPNITGASLKDAPAGQFVNPAAFAAPAPGQWGNARRNSIPGPNQFTLNADLSRTFRIKKDTNLEIHFFSTNLLNKVSYTSWNTNISNPKLFGVPQGYNTMRTIQTTLRLRF